MTTTTPSHRPRRRIRAVFASALALCLATAGLATAQESDESQPTVSTSAREPGRNLTVWEFGRDQELTQLTLRDGLARPFEVRVTDTDYDPSREFTVTATMNNLHRVGTDGLEASTQIASDNVSLGFAATPLRAVGNTIDYTSRLEIAGRTISCQDVTDLLGIDTGSLNLGLLNVLRSDPLCSLIAEVNGIDLFGSLTDLTGTLTSLLSAEIALADLPVVGQTLEALDLTELGLGATPLTTTVNGGGSFTYAECQRGITADFCDVETPTQRIALRSDGASSSLLGLLRDALAEGGTFAPTELLNQDGTDAFAGLTDVMESLGSIEGTVGDFASALAEYDDDTQRWQLLDGLLLSEEALPTSLLDAQYPDLTYFSGRYSSYPTLRVDLPQNRLGGEYEGTLVLTLVE